MTEDRTSGAGRAMTDAFIEEARTVTVGEAADRLGVTGLKRIATGEEAGPCPVCGGTDRFAVNRLKNAWICRGAGEGRDGISLAAHLLGLDVKRREDFLAACAAALGRDVPGEAPESAEDRAARDARLAARKAEAAAASEASEREANAFREREIGKARGKWEHAVPIDPHPEPVEGRGSMARASAGGVSPVLRQAQDEGNPRSAVRAYLTGRLGGFALPVLPFARAIVDEAYWHGTDEGGRPVAIHSGQAMVLPFVDAGGAVVGCHLTWLDARGRKGRPDLVDPATGERLATKKMRGRKKGGLIPLIGFLEIEGKILPDPARTRFVCGEGIENVLAVAVAEGARGDTIYAAAGDLGNLAGRAEGRFPHPTLKNRGGKAPLRVAGPEPKAGEPADAAAQVPKHVSEVLLVADADSEIVATGAAMMRAEIRFGAEGRTVATAWPPRGRDFADLLAAREVAA
ncbi:primase-helicase zinc-binding domain-containing protein [Aurantimonas sp. 22II-16-19i]|uniref:primase-helicase zinc-binding domain-containing protein n=1 Tax=Aurantimonas sp. 22II-16-19i TaxID=1317114 RepID=UPI0009F7DF7A|nr:primase-helicase zinc-binding domain-containing protein [Aurantimonas sp. 22II-16-19i]ORE90980.1 P4 alpha zinc-binding domain-containing protein [Aurantimonas sp. 22II-16-19i]